MRWLWLLAGMTWGIAAAQAEGPAPPAGAARQDAPSPEQIQQWIRDLDSERYQAREDATAALLRGGYEAVGPVAEAAAQGGLEVAIRAVYVLREAALSNDQRTAQAAERALEHLAQTRSVAAPRADHTLRDLAELRRRRIRAHFAELGAKFQSTQHLRTLDAYPDYFGIWLDEDWKGTEEDLAKLKFLTHITSVTVEGPQVKDSWLRHMAEMPNVTSVLIKQAGVSDAAAAELRRFPKLQELSIFYSPIGDASIEHLTALRGLTVLKVYGGQLSDQGRAALKTAFQQAATHVDLRKGAFLGVGGDTHPAGCLISLVREGSAAAKAGLQPGDIIVRYHGRKVESFEHLTALIAQHAAGETTELEILRGAAVLKKKVTLGQWE